ncbi:group II intron maturase-specific domain-containing protein [Streptomyces erythrochromogenes]
MKHGAKDQYRLVRYADDSLVLVFGRREHAEELRAEVAEALNPMGLRLSVEKTEITHIDEGLDFLGWCIQRHRKPGTDRQYIYTYPARKSVRSVTGKVKDPTGRQNVGLSLESLLHRLNSVLRGWCAYFRPGVSNVAFCYLSHYTWMRVTRWIRRKHPEITWKQLRRRYHGGGRWPVTEEAELFNPAKVSTTRCRYRGKLIPTPWPTTA